MSGNKSLLERAARPTIGVLGLSSYVAAGSLGYLAGLGLVLVLGTRSGLGPAGLAALALCPPLALLASILLARRLFRRPRIVFYQKASIAVAATVAGFHAAGEDLLIGADLAVLGVGTFLAFGRLGCFSVACCHGRRTRSGVRYGWAHAASGYPRRWVGLPVFPLQLADGAVSALAVALGTFVQISPGAPGRALAAYAVTYGLVRFGLEFLRGDAERSYFWGASEAQWTAAATAAIAASIAPSPWTALPAAVLAIAVAAIAVARRLDRWPALWLLSGPHLAELDAAIATLRAGGPAVTTSQGLRLALEAQPPDRFDLVLSRPDALSPATAAALARQLGRSWTVLGISAGPREHRVTLAYAVPPEAIVT